MSIVVSNLANGISDADSSSYNTSVISPTADGLIYVWAFFGGAVMGSAPGTAVCSGAGISWSLMEQLSSSSFVGVRAQLFVGRANPGFFAGALTFDLSPSLGRGVSYSVIQLTSTNGRIEGYDNAIATPSGSNPTLNMGTAPPGRSVLLGWWGKPNTVSFTGYGGGFTGIYNQTSAERTQMAEYRINPPDSIVSAVGSAGTDAKVAASLAYEIPFAAATIPITSDLTADGTILGLPAAASITSTSTLIATPLAPLYEASASITSTSNLAVSGSLILPQIMDVDDSVGRLGCGVPLVFITNRCGNGVRCVLDSINTLEYNRVLDGISEAVVTATVAGDGNSDCCACLRDIEPWCHELHIWRDGEEVWVGPIETIEYTTNDVTIQAKDVLNWLTVRVPEDNIDFTVANGTGPQEISVIAHSVIEVAFADDIETITCEYDSAYVEVTPYDPIEYFFQAFSGTCYNSLEELSTGGIDYTTLGRTIVITGTSDPLIPLVLLNDEHIKGDIVLRKDGSLQGNRVYVHFEGDGGLPVMGEAADFFCYGPIERMDEAGGLSDGAAAGQAADLQVAAGFIAPRIMEIPDGSQLSPDTPWTFNKMVPGTRVDVSLQQTCFPMTQSFRLTSVEVSYNQDDGESIGISVAPINGAEGGLSG